MPTTRIQINQQGKSVSHLIDHPRDLAIELVKQALPDSVLTYSVHDPLRKPDVTQCTVTAFEEEHGGARGKSSSFTVYGMDRFQIQEKIKDL